MSPSLSRDLVCELSSSIVNNGWRREARALAKRLKEAGLSPQLLARAPRSAPQMRKGMAALATAPGAPAPAEREGAAAQLPVAVRAGPAAAGHRWPTEAAHELWELDSAPGRAWSPHECQLALVGHAAVLAAVVQQARKRTR